MKRLHITSAAWLLLGLTLPFWLKPAVGLVLGLISVALFSTLAGIALVLQTLGIFPL